MKRLFLLSIVIIPLTLWSQVSMKDKLYKKEVFSSSVGDSIPYRILFPEDYSLHQKYPVILFLHGAGERGDDNQKQLIHGADFFIDPIIRKEHPAIVIFPQCAEGKYWANISIRESLHRNSEVDLKELDNPPVREQELALELLQSVISQESSDTTKIYLMGLSMGGFGTFDILARHPNLFAAAIPICRGGHPEGVSRYAATTAIWITHGADDNVVPVKYSRDMYKALKVAGADVKYTEFPDVNHNAWDPTFKLPGLMDWLFSKSR